MPSVPTSPTNAAIAPNAPTGAAHKIMASTRKTTRWRYSTTTRTGLPVVPIACTAKPTSSATKRVCRMSPEVSEEKSESGMMPSTKSTVLPLPFASARPSDARERETSSPSPGLTRLPTMRPIVSAKVDITRK